MLQGVQKNHDQLNSWIPMVNSINLSTLDIPNLECYTTAGKKKELTRILL